jgi:hypothetical protein
MSMGVAKVATPATVQVPAVARQLSIRTLACAGFVVGVSESKGVGVLYRAVALLGYTGRWVPAIGADPLGKGTDMRRLLMLTFVVALVLASAVPIGAAPMAKDTRQGIECLIPGNFEEAKVWFSGQDDTTMHIRGLVNTATEWSYADGAWEMVGNNVIVVNFNGAWMEVEPFPGFKIKVPTVGSYWGTFDLSLGDEDFEGTWSWGKGTVDGRGSATGDGQLMKVALLGEDPGWDGIAEFEACPEPGFVEYTVMSK